MSEGIRSLFNFRLKDWAIFLFTKVYDGRDDFSFRLIDFSFLDGNVSWPLCLGFEFNDYFSPPVFPP